jgi:hypothetical protein
MYTFKKLHKSHNCIRDKLFKYPVNTSDSSAVLSSMLWLFYSNTNVIDISVRLSLGISVASWNNVFNSPSCKRFIPRNFNWFIVMLKSVHLDLYVKLNFFVNLLPTSLFIIFLLRENFENVISNNSAAIESKTV